MKFRLKRLSRKKQQRLIPPIQIQVRDGKFEIMGIGAWHSYWRDPYHLLLTIPWTAFLILIFTSYITINALFALAYLIGGDCIANARPGSFLDVFFFSANYKFPRHFAQLLLRNLGRLTKVSQKIARPRLAKIAHNPLIWRINGFCISLLTILLILPIPFTNPIPTVGILLLTVATIESDGLLICISYGITVLITLLFGFIGYAIWLAPSLLPSIFK